VKRLKVLEQENGRLRRAVADPGATHEAPHVLFSRWM
jgi:hypothetical protein